MVIRALRKVPLASLFPVERWPSSGSIAMHARGLLSVLIIVTDVGFQCSHLLFAAERMTSGQAISNEPRSPLLGIGYHPGNFVGRLAFEVIVRPFAHFALDVQAGTDDFSGQRAALAPQLQWEFFKRPSTPYLGSPHPRIPPATPTRWRIMVGLARIARSVPCAQSGRRASIKTRFVSSR
jgi:hypothetical protein